MSTPRVEGADVSIEVSPGDDPTLEVEDKDTWAMAEALSQWRLDSLDAEFLARHFHDLYEQLAPDFGYGTRAETAIGWDELPDANRMLMTEVATRIVEKLRAGN